MEITPGSRFSSVHRSAPALALSLGFLVALSPSESEARIPINTCARYITPAIESWDLRGDKEFVRFTSANLDTNQGWIEYGLSIDEDQCVGGANTYRLRVYLDGGDPDSLFVDVLTSGGSRIGSLEWNRGVGARLRSPQGAPIVLDEYGPTLVGPAQVGGTPGWPYRIDDSAFYQLTDARVLMGLYPPTTLNGAAPANWVQEFSLDLAYTNTVEAHFGLFELMTYRGDLDSLSSTRSLALADLAAAHIVSPGEKSFGGEQVWVEHRRVNHSLPLSPSSATSYGGFFNGHQNYLLTMEEAFEAGGDVPAPFGRIPLWKPEDRLNDFWVRDPGPTDLKAPRRRRADPLPEEFHVQNMCENFSAPNLTGLFLALTGPDTVSGWHRDVHIQIGGSMAEGMDSAGVEIFWPWHTTVDTVWRNFDLCWAN